MSITPSPTPEPQDKPSEGSGPSGYVSTSSVRSAWSKATGEGESGRPASSAPLWAVIALAVVSLGGLGGMFYYAQSLNDRLDQVNTSLQSALSSQGETLAQLNERLDKGDARDSELKGQVAQTQNRLGLTQSEIQKARQTTAAELARQQKEAQEAAQQLASQLGQLQQETVATKGNVTGLSTDIAGVRGDVKSTRDELAATRSQLQRVIGDLGVQSDLVAHNRTELEDLKLRGERDYVEFDLRKSNRRQRVGSVQLELTKTDPKKQKYTVNLVVDDRTIEKKDKNVFEPVQFYQTGFRAPTEVVVNKIEKDRIVGYVSSPKKKEDRAPMRSAG